MSEHHYWLVLSRAMINPTLIHHWLEHHAIQKLFSTSEKELIQHGFNPTQIEIIKQPNWPLAETDLAWCKANHCQLITATSEQYPTLLRQTPGAPILLYVQGNANLLNQPQIAIVGSRNPTVTGIELANQFSQHLARAGLNITSGLALGIDAACHRAALAAEGNTIAVMGTGLKNIYPVSHQKLASAIREKGALISEFPLDALPKALHFPMRNRIISGLSLGVLVIEAAIRSGSLITARLALEQNREVFAIPGSIHNPLAKGCHQLIRQGAKLVETAQDILEELGTLNAALTEENQKYTPVKRLDIPPQDAQILAQIGYEVTPFDVIIQRSGLTAGKLSSILLSLELAGYLHVVQGGYLRAVIN